MSQSVQEHNVKTCEEEKLHLTIRIPAESNAGNYVQSFRENGFEVSETNERGEKTLSLVAGMPMVLDVRLRGFLKLLDEINDSVPGQAPAELLEARIASRNSLEYLGSDSPTYKGGGEVVNEDSHLEKELGLRLGVGRAFGSGIHPSTRLVIEALGEMSQADRQPFPGRVLDVGCGTGILSMVAAKLGAEKVVGIDISPEALDVAKVNVTTNHLENIIEIKQAQLQEIDESFDLIVANISPSVLFNMINRISILLDSSGSLLLSGFRDRQSIDVDRRCRQNGLTKFNKTSKGSWTSMLYRKG